SAAAAPCSKSVAVRRKKLLVCFGRRSSAGGSPAIRHEIGVYEGLSSAGMNTSLVRHGLLVAGVTMARPALLAIRISLRGTEGSNGPSIATTLVSATKPCTLAAPSSGLGLPPLASSVVVS